MKKNILFLMLFSVGSTFCAGYDSDGESTNDIWNEYMQKETFVNWYCDQGETQIEDSSMETTSEYRLRIIREYRNARVDILRERNK